MKLGYEVPTCARRVARRRAYQAVPDDVDVGGVLWWYDLVIRVHLDALQLMREAM